MIQMSLKQAADLLHCTPAQKNVTFAGITTDSRQVVPGMLFAALPGQSVDGHDYIPQAIERGAVAVLVSRDTTGSVPSLRVDNVLAALGVLAAHWRGQCPARVVGITGSNGKTTVKEMIASILRQAGRVLATRGNYNNELGLPLTIFQLEKSHDYAVLEMGASKRGDIAYLAGIARPEVGVIINVGPAHLEGFKSLQGVALGKGEMYAALPPGGTAIINAAEPWVDTWLEINKAERVIYFNGDGDNHVRAIQVEDGVAVETAQGRFSLALPLPGQHNLSNALAATAVCLALDIPLGLIKSGLEAVQPVPGRLSLKHASRGWTVIDDTYNANPASLYAALQVLAGQHGEPWLVMGDMKELGSDSRKLHAELGDAARSFGVKRLFAVGEASAAAVDAFGDHAEHFGSREGLIDALRAQLRPGVTCLVKGSRSMGMEHVVKAISNGQDYLEATG
jgi:UDP-N-acetylmuramoyl-tripeptide--D-alanyl-D-alanine ligase